MKTRSMERLGKLVLRANLLFLGILLLLVNGRLMAQANVGPYAVGEQAITFTDAGLTAPNVSAHTWYPGTTAGTAAPLATGAFPVLAFGHGFNLNYLDYQQICSHLASWGFIVVSPDVQNGFNVSHQEFARELAACITYLQGAGADNQSLYYQHVDTMSGVLGHSMGGGASALVPSVFPSIDAVGGLASAETNPSAIAALGSYSGPYQIISGSSDNTAPEATNQTPMYNAAQGDKQWLSITGGAHCKFTDAPTVCDFVSSAGTVTRPFQILMARRYATAFFRYHLQGAQDALTFLCGDSLTADVNAGAATSLTQYVCTVAAAEPQAQRCFDAHPNPCGDQLRLSGAGAWVMYDATGAAVRRGSEAAEATVDMRGLPSGLYLVAREAGGCRRLIVHR